MHPTDKSRQSVRFFSNLLACIRRGRHSAARRREPRVFQQFTRHKQHAHARTPWRVSQNSGRTSAAPCRRLIDPRWRPCVGSRKYGAPLAGPQSTGTTDSTPRNCCRSPIKSSNYIIVGGVTRSMSLLAPRDLRSGDDGTKVTPEPEKSNPGRCLRQRSALDVRFRAHIASWKMAHAQRHAVHADEHHVLVEAPKTGPPPVERT